MIRKVWRQKISKIKYEKNTSPCRALHPFDPARRNRKLTRIEPAMLNFRSERERALPAPHGLMGLIMTSLLGTCGAGCSLKLRSRIEHRRLNSRPFLVVFSRIKRNSCSPKNIIISVTNQHYYYKTYSQFFYCICWFV